MIYFLPQANAKGMEVSMHPLAAKLVSLGKKNIYTKGFSWACGPSLGQTFNWANENAS